MGESLSKYYDAILESQQLNLDAFFNKFDQQKLIPPTEFNIKIPSSFRLGHFAEQIFVELVKHNLSDKKVISNIQISNNNITEGELDVIIYDQQNMEHVEFCYKFYLLDENADKDEFYNWIGPNRRDALYLKVKKLSDRQLPLLYSWNASRKLQSLIPNFGKLKKIQSVCFLAQLFVPFSMWKSQEKFKIGSPTGFYIYFDELENFDALWHISDSKKDWLLPVNNNTGWLSNSEFIKSLKKYYEKNSNPLCWMKDNEEKIQKCFVLNWKKTS